MAKPKQKVLVVVLTPMNPEPIQVWIDNPGEVLQDIRSIEGVIGCRACTDGPIRVSIDKRYDAQEIADEIEELLTSDVPAIFEG